MIAQHHTIELKTRGNDHILDLPGQLQSLVAETGVTTGQVVLMVQGSTGALPTLEFEPGLVTHDIAAAMETIAPRDGRYLHEETWHDDNGHFHVRASLVGALPRATGGGGQRPPRHLAAGRPYGAMLALEYLAGDPAGVVSVVLSNPVITPARGAPPTSAGGWVTSRPRFSPRSSRSTISVFRWALHRSGTSS